MSYTTNGDGWVSIQYNQDWNVDNQCQPAIGGHGGTDWVQAVIVGTSSNNCGGFAFEVINQLWGWDDYLWQYNNALCGQIVNGIFSNGAQWSVAEYTDSNGKIDQVNYYIIGGGSGGGSFFYDYFPPTNWYWYRSQVCWCGADLGEYATFTSGSGWLDYYAGLNFIAWSPPITIGTGEDSNMLYYCFVNIGTTHMYQGFSYSGSHC